MYSGGKQWLHLVGPWWGEMVELKPLDDTWRWSFVYRTWNVINHVAQAALIINAKIIPHKVHLTLAKYKHHQYNKPATCPCLIQDFTMLTYCGILNKRGEVHSLRCCPLWVGHNATIMMWPNVAQRTLSGENLFWEAPSLVKCKFENRILNHRFSWAIFCLCYFCLICLLCHHYCQHCHYCCHCLIVVTTIT